MTEQRTIREADIALTFYGQKKGMRMTPCLLSPLGDPEYIGFAFNRQQKILLLLPTTADDPNGIKVTENFVGQMLHRSRFHDLIYSIAGWNTNLSYRISGKYSKSRNCIYFDLKRHDIMWKGRKIFRLVKGTLHSSS